jgi:hypothetical protein
MAIMRVLAESEDEFSIRAAPDEIRILANCINEAAEIPSDNEFHARVGATKQEALDLLRAMQTALRLKGP